MIKTIHYLFTYLLAAFTSLAILFYLNPSPSADKLDVDEAYYFKHAERLVSGEYELNSYRPIGFPLILALGLYTSNSSLLGAHILLILLSSLRAPLVYALAYKISGNPWVSLLSGILMALWPTAAFLSESFYSESVSLVFFLAFLNVLPKEGNVGRWILAGFLLAITLLIHPMYLIFLPFAFFIIWIEQGKFLKAVKYYLWLVLTLAITLFPWSYAISKKEGSFLILSTNSADAMAGGLNDKLIQQGYVVNKTPSGRLAPGGPGMWIHDSGYLTEEENALPPKERNELLYKRLFEWMRNNPDKVLYLEAAKLLNLWGFYPIIWEIKTRVFFGNIPIIILSILSVISLVVFHARFLELVRLWMIPLFVSTVGLIGIGSWRYRLPADAVLIILASLLIIYIISRRSPFWK